MSTDNPFCWSVDPAVYGGLTRLCHVTAADRVGALRGMDAATLKQALQVPELQATVRRAIESRLRVLEGAPAVRKHQTAMLTEAISRNMGTRFCSSCQTDRPTEGGKWSVDKSGARRRWRCAACLHRAAHKLPHKGFRL